MLAYFLAILGAITSLTLYLNAFIKPKIHRQDDFLWSGLGLFYSLVLWFSAGRITGALLLGQLAGMAVAIAFIWENQQLRKTITTSSESNIALEGFSILSFIAQSLAKKPKKDKKQSVKSEDKTTPEENEISPSPEINTSTEEETSPEIKIESSETTTSENTVIDEREEKEVINLANETTVIEEKVNTEFEVNNIDKKEELTSELTNPEIADDDDFEISSIGESSREKPRKPNIFNKIINIFRKSPKNLPSSASTSNLEKEIETDEEEIETQDLNTEITVTEVEYALDNLEIKETVVKVEVDKSPSSEETGDNPVNVNTQLTAMLDEEKERDEEVNLAAAEGETSPEEVEVKIEEREVLREEKDNQTNNEIEAETKENNATDTKELEIKENVPPEDTINSLADVSIKVE